MVFANLTEEDKQAFFDLLDEYFASRPELANALGLATTTAPAARVSSTSSPLASVTGNPDIASAVGRVAAASRAFNTPTPPVSSPSPASQPARPPAPPRRTSTGPGAGEQRPGLATQRKLGDLDTSSVKNMFWGMRNKDAVPAAPVPPALPKSSAKAFAPPPVRRVAAVPAPAPKRPPTPEPEGEWAEALYDYVPTDPNDLALRENQRVLVTARTSDDWWTGELDGKSGMFPATYVKLL